MAFTVMYSGKRVNELKKQERYREAIDYLKDVIEKHRNKQGFHAWFKNENPLKEMLGDLEILRKVQCVEKAKKIMRADSGDGERPLDSTSLHYFKEAGNLLAEAERIDSTSEARLMLDRAKDCIEAVESFAKAESLCVERRLNSARKFLSKIAQIHPRAKSRLEEIDAILDNCARSKRSAEENISGRDFVSARKNLEDILVRMSEDPHLEVLEEKIRKGERADELARAARENAGSDDKRLLYAALSQLADAVRMDKDVHGAQSLEAKIKERLAGLLYREGLDSRDREKDLDGAAAKFKEIERLGVAHRDSETILEELLDTKNRISALYEKGAACGKNLPDALEAFRSAARFGFPFKDLDQRIQACERDLRKCERLASDAESSMEKESPDYDSAMSLAREALALYPGFSKASELLEKARREKRIREAVADAEARLNSPNFRYQDALAAVDRILALDPENARAFRLREQVVSKTLETLEDKAVALAGERKRITDAVRLIKEVENSVPLTPALKSLLEDLERKGDEARKIYQIGFERLNQARKTAISDVSAREPLYVEAAEKLRQALGINANLSPMIGPELEKLKRERAEWRAYLQALEQFREKAHEKCLETLEPYRRAPLLAETDALVVDVLNELGFSGVFRLETDGAAFVVVPDDAVFVGRNTEKFRENQVPLRLADVSRKHGKITRTNGRFLYENRPECWHGAMLNGRLIDDRAVELKEGDVLGFGFFKEEDGSPAGEPPAVRLSLRRFGPDRAPSLAISPAPSENREFCEDTRKTHILMGDRITVGRSPENAVKINNPSVEPVHVSIDRKNDRYFISDLDTPGGTFLNDEPLAGERALRLGDRIRIGTEELRIVNYEQ